jgi:hypothetical protein
MNVFSKGGVYDAMNPAATSVSAEGETQAKRSASKTQNYRPDGVGVQVMNQAKTGQYGQSHYCAGRLEIEITVWV